MGEPTEGEFDEPEGEFDERGHRVRHDTSGMEPVDLTIYWNPVTRRYYNAQGVWVDSLGRLMPHRGPASKTRSKGKRSGGNRNPGGPGANPPHVHGRFGERAQLPSGGSASSGVSRGPPEWSQWRRLAESGQPEAAQGPPEAAQGPPAAAQGPPAAAQGPPAAARSRRAYSTGPPQDTRRGRANRDSWLPRSNRSRDGDWNRGRW